MKRVFVVLLPLMLLLSLFAGCAANEDVGGDVYFRNVYPNTTNTYSLGSAALQWNNAWITNINGAPFVPGVAAPHNLLSATHPDSTAAAAVRGDVITGQGVAPKWARLAIGGAGTYLKSNGTDISWQTAVASETDPVFLAALPLSPFRGGTGIANNNASTLTWSGDFATTFTRTNVTNVTFPTTGTLVTLVGTEELTNKTLTSSVGKGTWTASGTWTLPSVTFNANPIINNNIALQWKDVGGTPRDVFNLFNWLDILPTQNLDAIWWLSSGTGRTMYLWATASTAIDTVKDSPTLDFNANYWTGAVNTNREAKITHKMITAGAAPKSILATYVDSIPVIGAVNDNATVSTILYGDLNANTHYLTNVIDPVNPQDAATRNYVLTTPAGSATTVAITDDIATNATMYPAWVTANTGNLPVKVSSTKLSFNPSTGAITHPYVYGGSAANDDITIEGTSSATKTTSYVILQPTSGNVGIGTTTPISRLDLGTATATNTQMAILARQASPGDSDFRLALRSGTGTGSNAEFFRLGIDYATDRNAGISFYRGTSGTGGFLTFDTNNGSEQVRIDRDGNVGIGTIGPATKLDVNGVITATGGNSTTWNAAAPTANPTFSGVLTVPVGTVGAPSITFSGDTSAGIYHPGANEVAIATGGNRALIVSSAFWRGTGATGGVSIVPNAAGSASAPIYSFDGDLDTGMYRSAANELRFSTNASDRVTIDSTGNVGIGAASPTAVLHLKAGTATASTASLKIDAGVVLGATEAGAIESDGTNLYWTDAGGTRRQLNN